MWWIFNLLRSIVSLGESHCWTPHILKKSGLCTSSASKKLTQTPVLLNESGFCNFIFQKIDHTCCSEAALLVADATRWSTHQLRPVPHPQSRLPSRGKIDWSLLVWIACHQLVDLACDVGPWNLLTIFVLNWQLRRWRLPSGTSSVKKVRQFEGFSRTYMNHHHE